MLFEILGGNGRRKPKAKKPQANTSNKKAKRKVTKRGK